MYLFEGNLYLNSKIVPLSHKTGVPSLDDLDIQVARRTLLQLVSHVCVLDGLSIEQACRDGHIELLTT